MDGLKVRLGIDRLEENKTLFTGKRIGLITNFSGVDSDLNDNIRLFLDAGLKIKKVFSPEHGIYGVADGQAVSDSIHPEYKVPVISLYGDKKKPGSDDLSDIDLLVYDIQDAGVRYYTYIYTLAYSMEAASELNKELIVLDRPNPLGKTVKGSRIQKEYESFVGGYALPIRYGMTPGELARYFKNEFKIDVDLDVIRMDNYKPDMQFPETGLLWNVPSPAIPTYASNVCYSGGCFIEATNLSEGRGSPKPFQMYGAPWVDMDKIYKWLNKRPFEGFQYRKRAFVPFSSKHENDICFGIEFFPVEREADFLPQILYFMRGITEIHGDKISYNQYADVSRLESLSGDDRIRDYLEGRMELDTLLEQWRSEEKGFEQLIQNVRLY